MSDTTRQSLTDRAKAAITPDSTKDNQRIAQEEMRGKLDKAHSHLQPESEKSYLQKGADKLREVWEGDSGATQQHHVQHQPPQQTTHSGTYQASGTAYQTEEDKGLFQKAKEAITGHPEPPRQ